METMVQTQGRTDSTGTPGRGRIPLPGRRALRAWSVALLAGASLAWAAAGANLGWTKTSVPVRTLDEVTGLEAVTYQPRFVPGVELLAGSAALAAALAAASLLVPSRARATARSLHGN